MPTGFPAELHTTAGNRHDAEAGHLVRTVVVRKTEDCAAAEPDRLLVQIRKPPAGCRRR